MERIEIFYTEATDKLLTIRSPVYVAAKIAYSAPKSVVSLAEGMPNEETFPFTEIAIKLNDGSSFTLNERELGAALQYIPTQGYPPLLQVTKNSVLFVVIFFPI